MLLQASQQTFWESSYNVADFTEQLCIFRLSFWLPITSIHFYDPGYFNRCTCQFYFCFHIVGRRLEVWSKYIPGSWDAPHSLLEEPCGDLLEGLKDPFEIYNLWFLESEPSYEHLWEDFWWAHWKSFDKCVLSHALLSSGQIKNTSHQHFSWNSSIFDSVASE